MQRLSRLNRIPLLAWFLFTLALCYASWNPSGYSLWSYLWGDGDKVLRSIVFVVLLSIFSLYLLETSRSFNKWGFALLLALLSLVAYKTIDLGWINPRAATWPWFVPAVAALILTLGLRGKCILMWASGTVPVQAVEDMSAHHHSGD